QHPAPRPRPGHNEDRAHLFVKLRAGAALVGSDCRPQSNELEERFAALRVRQGLSQERTIHSSFIAPSPFESSSESPPTNRLAICAGPPGLGRCACEPRRASPPRARRFLRSQGPRLL